MWPKLMNFRDKAVTDSTLTDRMLQGITARLEDQDRNFQTI